MADIKISDAADPGTLLTTDRFPLARSGSTTAYAGSVEEMANFAAEMVYRGIWRPATNSPNIAGGDTLDGANYIAVTTDPTVPEQAPAIIPGLGNVMVRNGDRIIWASALAQWQRLPGGTLANPLTVQFSTMNGVQVAPFGFNCYASGGSWHSVATGPVATFMLDAASGTLQTWAGQAGAPNVAPTFLQTMAVDGFGNVVTAGTLRANGSRIMSYGVNSQPSVVCFDQGTINSAAGMWMASNQTLAFGQTNGVGTPVTTFGDFDFTGSFTIVNQAYKPGGGPWTAPSDDRIKRDVEPYTSGLAEVIALQPVSYQYNGQGGTVDDGRRYVGLSAQATQEAMPELVVPMQGKEALPGQLGTDLGPLLLAVCNAVRELSERVAALER